MKPVAPIGQKPLVALTPSEKKPRGGMKKPDTGNNLAAVSVAQKKVVAKLNGGHVAMAAGAAGQTSAQATAAATAAAQAKIATAAQKAATKAALQKASKAAAVQKSALKTGQAQNKAGLKAIAQQKAATAPGTKPGTLGKGIPKAGAAPADVMNKQPTQPFLGNGQPPVWTTKQLTPSGAVQPNQSSSGGGPGSAVSTEPRDNTGKFASESKPAKVRMDWMPEGQYQQMQKGLKKAVAARKKADKAAPKVVMPAGPDPSFKPKIALGGPGSGPHAHKVIDPKKDAAAIEKVKSWIAKNGGVARTKIEKEYTNYGKAGLDRNWTNKNLNPPGWNTQDPNAGNHEGVGAAEMRQFDPGVGGGVDRDKLPKSDFASPQNRKFPIVAPKDVKDAARLVGHAPNKGQVKANIKAIATRKGFPLPDSLKAADQHIVVERTPTEFIVHGRHDKHEDAAAHAAKLAKDGKEVHVFPKRPIKAAEPVKTSPDHPTNPLKIKPPKGSAIAPAGPLVFAGAKK